MDGDPVGQIAKGWQNAEQSSRILLGGVASVEPGGAFFPQRQAARQHRGWPQPLKSTWPARLLHPACGALWSLQSRPNTSYDPRERCNRSIPNRTGEGQSSGWLDARVFELGIFRTSLWCGIAASAENLLFVVLDRERRDSTWACGLAVSFCADGYIWRGRFHFARTDRFCDARSSLCDAKLFSCKSSHLL